MGEFEECLTLRTADGEVVTVPAGYQVYRNNGYQIWKRELRTDVADAPRAWHLSIKRNDRAPIHDWRDLQRIKNELCGPETEAVELYPAESRRVDAANLYHLWVFEFRFPFGFDERLVSESEELGCKQRPFRPGDLAGVLA